MSHETVGSLLAIIANSLNDGLRILMFADKRAWGSDEFEQLRLLEETLDEAKKDFQELPTLVNGRFYYENDRISMYAPPNDFPLVSLFPSTVASQLEITHSLPSSATLIEKLTNKPNPNIFSLRTVTDESLEDLRILCTRFELHTQTFKDWVRSGATIDPSWARETLELRRDLHRAQCRAARRIHAAQQVHSTTGSERTRCLGALQVYRVQARRDVRVEEEREVCAQTGRFERFAERDVAFVCDFCDGFLVWEDMRAVPTTRLSQPPVRTQALPTHNLHIIIPNSASTTTPTPSSTQSSHVNTNGPDVETDEPTPASANWQARGIAMSTGEAKTVVFAPVAIANHLPPEIGEFQCRILCPQCDEYYYEEQGDDEMDRVRYMQDDRGLEHVKAFQEHLEWSHASMVPDSSNCAVM
ncbi:hypothetical protein F5Y02DRAFT_158173 [Annulohypoxylon stygium]|nr:hypothetical protein F5Y02DRAFT_158173 [Annulohypoxylon stygium]